MEYHKVLLQKSTSSASNLKCTKKCNATNPAQMKNEFDSLRVNHKEVDSDKKTNERDLATYVGECKALNQNLSELRKSHDCNASTSAKLLHEVTSHNKKLMSIQAELEGNLDRKMKEIEAANKNWSRKFESLEQKNLRNVEENSELKKRIEEKRSIEKTFVNSKRQLTAMIQDVKENECKAKSEAESWKNALSIVEVNHEKEITRLQKENSDLVTQLGLATQQKAAYRESKEMEFDLHNVQKELDKITKEKENLQDQFIHLQKKFTAMVQEAKQNEAKAKLEVESSKDAFSTFEASYKEAIGLLRIKNHELTEKLALLSQQRDEACNKVSDVEYENRRTTEEMEALTKAVTTMKSTCNMQDEQISDLEGLNKQLRFHNEQLLQEKESAILEISSLQNKLCACKNIVAMKNTEMITAKNDLDEMIQLQNELQEKIIKEQMAHDQLVNLERKNKLQEMHIGVLQKKLHNKKISCDRLKLAADSYEKRIEMLKGVHSHASTKLAQQHKQHDALAYERTRLLNEVDDMKMNFSHEAIRFNSTIGQQSKLIDFLQARIESFEHHDKKKKRRKIDDLYQVPLQYKELQDMLEESKQVNLQLQAKVNSLRTELQTALSEVDELKQGLPSIDCMSSVETGTSIPAFKVSAAPLTPVQNDYMGLHHSLVKNICTHSTQCRVCLDCVRFGLQAFQCYECNSWYHIKCKDDINNLCKQSVVQPPHLKDREKELTSSAPMSCVAVNEEGNLFAWLKVLCDGQSWKRKWVQLQDGALIIHNCEKTVLNLFKLTKRAADNEERETLDLLQQQCYIHATVPSSELTTTDSADHSLVFKLELFSGAFLHTNTTVYFMSSSFSDKRKWVAALQKLSMFGLSFRNAVSNSKLSGNKIVTLEARDKLKINCSLPISKEKVLFGCDEGLYVLTPSSSHVCNRSHIDAVKGADQILQMELLIPSNLIVAIEGMKKRLVSFDIANLMSKTSLNVNFVKLCLVDNLLNCHLFALGSVEGDPNICAATASSVHIYRFNRESARFEKKQDILVAEPCTCLQFTLCSVILGTSKFLEIELKNFKLDDFLNPCDRSLLCGTDALPVAMIQIGETNGIHEYLLCYHEYGIFVDCFGSRTRNERIIWSRLPVSFAYREPHLMIMHLSSIEFMLIHPLHDSRHRKTTHQVYIDLPNARYLGSAITDGAVYVSGNDSDKVTVYCCKGVLESVTGNGKSAENLWGKKIVSSDTISEVETESNEYSEYSEISSSSTISSAHSPRRRK